MLCNVKLCYLRKVLQYLSIWGRTERITTYRPGLVGYRAVEIESVDFRAIVIIHVKWTY